jgi:hypothetical protein
VIIRTRANGQCSLVPQARDIWFSFPRRPKHQNTTHEEQHILRGSICEYMPNYFLDRRIRRGAEGEVVKIAFLVDSHAASCNTDPGARGPK